MNQSELSDVALEDGFEIICKLGAGTFAEVYKAKEKKGDQKEVAIKRIMLEFYEEEDALKEVENLRDFKSDHIIDYYGYVRE